MNVNPVNNYNIFSLQISDSSTDCMNETIKTINDITTNKEKNLIILTKNDDIIIFCQLNSSYTFSFREASFNDKFKFISDKFKNKIEIKRLTLKSICDSLISLLCDGWHLLSFPK